MSRYISVECEYDISGNFGGNNNQEVLLVSEKLSTEEVDDLVLDYVHSRSGVSKEDLEELYWWNYIEVKELK